ncbi:MULTISPECIES: sensor histidine kinase [unclassified Crossiella]|uniref:sensor histidine kinase n=1 Tax=unclassified Crossiella TaxID=2620835 RepID=UPI001FFED644|nr:MULTISPECIES: histidine kinase [unclassified Crossiella]MCK2239633.1 histidine kinase [Crossiella sp. S99.2]MCK2252328.1 histidine kinase [Crossiella sp. S99.1]
MPFVERRLPLTGVAVAVLPVCLAVPWLSHLGMPDRGPSIWRSAPFLALSAALLALAASIRLRHGLPSPWQRAAVLVPQLLLALAALIVLGPSTFAPVFAACTLLVLLPDPWSGRGFVAVLAVEVFLLALVSDSLVPVIIRIGHSLAVGLAVYASVRVAELALELNRTRASLASLAVARERTRVSRDLHDSLGQEITAIGLRAELAARLAVEDPDGAAEHLGVIQRITEHTMSTVRRVANGDWQPDLGEEISSGIALLTAAGIRYQLRFGAVVPGHAAEAVSWVVREAVTNVLKHSTARRFLLTTEDLDGWCRLTVENDGVRPATAPPGSGQAGLTARITALGGRLRAGRVGRTRYRLVVEIPTMPSSDAATAAAATASEVPR